LTVIGVTDEPAGKVRPVIAKHSVEYLIAVGSTRGYDSEFIPHSWLVGPGGRVVWDGSPFDLNDGLIEKHLKDVQLQPVFDLPEALGTAGTALNSGKYARGIHLLERYIKKKTPRTEPGATAVPTEAVAAAQEALERVRTYGRGKLQKAVAEGEQGFYTSALGRLKSLERDFKGDAIAKDARKQVQLWRRDKAVKVELTAEAILAKANGLVRVKKHKEAAGYLRRLLSSKKFSQSKHRDRGQALFDSIQGKL